MTINGDAFENAPPAATCSRARCDWTRRRSPAHMDLLHAGGDRWEAVYEVTADGFAHGLRRAGGKDPRPAAFTTSETTEESLVVLRHDAK